MPTKIQATTTTADEEKGNGPSAILELEMFKIKQDFTHSSKCAVVMLAATGSLVTTLGHRTMDAILQNPNSTALLVTGAVTAASVGLAHHFGKQQKNQIGLLEDLARDATRTQHELQKENVELRQQLEQLQGNHDTMSTDQARGEQPARAPDLQGGP